MSKDLIHNLRRLKSSPEAGAVDIETQSRIRESVMEAIQHTSDREEYSFQDHLAYFRWMFGDMVSRPLVVTASAFVLLFGGWMGSVNAASQSLPGDALYHVKIASERMRLKFASSDQRAVLHTEFAHRRLQEALAIHSLDALDRDERYRGALDAYRAEMASATQTLQSLEATIEELKVVEVAAKLDLRMGELGTTAGQLPESESGNLQDTVKNATNSVVDVLVGVNEARQTSGPVEENVQATFKKDYNLIQNRQKFNLGRIAVLQEKLEQEGYEDLIVQDELLQIRLDVKESMNKAHEAQTLAAASGYRAAFDLLREVDRTLLALETKIAQIEVAVVEASLQKNEGEVTEEEMTATEDNEELDAQL